MSGPERQSFGWIMRDTLRMIFVEAPRDREFRAVFATALLVSLAFTGLLYGIAWVWPA